MAHDYSYRRIGEGGMGMGKRYSGLGSGAENLKIGGWDFGLIMDK